MKPSNHDVTLVMDQPDSLNSSLRRKANLMRLSRSPAKLRPSLISGPQVGNVSSSIATPEQSLDNSPGVVRSNQSQTFQSPSFSKLQSNRSTVFRNPNSTAMKFATPSSQPMIEEDESSAYLEELSTSSGQMRVVSHGQAGELQFKPAASTVIQKGTKVQAQDFHDSKGLSLFQTRFKNAAVMSLQTIHKPIASSQLRTVSVGTPAGISWDNIMETNAGTGNSRTPSTYDNSLGWTEKRGEYEKFDDCSSVGTDILRDESCSKPIPFPTQANKTGTIGRDFVNRATSKYMLTNEPRSNTGRVAYLHNSQKNAITPQISTFKSEKSIDTHAGMSSTKSLGNPSNVNPLESTVVQDNLISRDTHRIDNTILSAKTTSLHYARKTHLSSLRIDYESKIPPDTSSGDPVHFDARLVSKSILKKIPELHNGTSNSPAIYLDESNDAVDLDRIPCIEETNNGSSSNKSQSSQPMIQTYGPKSQKSSTSERKIFNGRKLSPIEAFSDTKPTLHNHGYQGRGSLSEGKLKINNSRYSSEDKPIPANNIKGFRGFINKTQGTPALADYDSDSVVTASTTTDLQNDPPRNLHSPASSSERGKLSERYDTTISNTHVFRAKISNQVTSHSMPVLNPIAKLQHNIYHGSDEMNFAKIGNTLSAIVSTPEAFQKRMVHTETFSDSDSLLDRNTNANDLAFNGDVPDFNNEYETSSHPDLSTYLVDPVQVQALVRKYRKISDALVERGYDPVFQEDAKKAFALFEMRSRIMETDIERRLGRRGGTTMVDDIVVTEFYKAMYRVRDAVIVSKAWRDGASPKDAFTALTLTRKAYIYSVRKPHRGRSTMANKNSSSLFGHSKNSFSWGWEEVLWVDDTEFTLLRCPSQGPKLMRGSEIFTVGDCQSILLKLTHERCEQLRQELNKAATVQLYAKEMMKEEAEFIDLPGVEGMMTDLEMNYLSATEQVKSISKQLVLAEKSFTMVKERVERLVHKYEHILERIDQNGEDVSSTDDHESFDQEAADLSDDEANERGRLERRAERAELKAELAAREAILLTMTVEKTKKEAESIRMEKEREILELQKRLDDLEKKSAFLAREYESRLSLKILERAKLLTRTDLNKEPRALSVHSADDDASAAKERIKAKFRNRRNAIYALK